jgi:phosphinothricin acetyltransferase
VADDAGKVLGWVACIPYSWREAYRGVVEHGIYLEPGARGRGVGLALMRALIASTEAAGIWCVQSGIFRDNTASLALHRKAGFREIGYRERVGNLHGVWHDVILVERRSPLI